MSRWFERLFGESRRPQAPCTPILPSGLQPIERPETLLASRASAIAEIDQLMAFPAQQAHDYVYQALLEYARFIQLLPLPGPEHPAGRRAVLDHTLDVVRAALKITRGYLLPPGCAPETAGSRRGQWSYAVFAAALLQGIDLSIAQEVMLYTVDGRPAAVWNPWQGTMHQAPGAVAYKVAPHRGDRPACPGARAMLAPRIVPRAALAWIGADCELMPVWIAALTSDLQSAGAIGEIIKRAGGRCSDAPPNTRVEPVASSSQPDVVPTEVSAAAADPYSIVEIPGIDTQIPVGTDEVDPETGLGVPVIDSSASAPEIGGGQRFLTWLREEIVADRIAINTSTARVHRVPEGLLLVSPGLFRDFVQARPEAGTADQAQRRFLRLGLHRRIGKGTSIVTYEATGSGRPGVVLNGILLEDPKLVLGDRLVPVNPRLARTSPL